MDRGASPPPLCHRVDQQSVLQKLAHEVVEQAKRAYARDGGKVTRFHSTRYQAGTWSRPRREVFKGTPWVWATMETLQLRSLKLGACVQECTDRIKIALPSSCPVGPNQSCSIGDQRCRTKIKSPPS